ncbi:hypothetical protein ACVR2O_004308 [Cronobacter turicensis]
MSVYDKSKQLIASGTKGNNDVLALAGTGDSGYFSFGECSISPVNLSKGTNGGNKQSGINETGKIEKNSSSGKIGREHVIKLLISLEDWGRILYQLSGE